MAGYVKPYKLRALLAISGVVMTATLANIQPTVIGNAIDAALRGNLHEVQKNGFLFLLFAINIPVYAVFAMLGSLLGLAFFRKKVPPTTNV